MPSLPLNHTFLKNRVSELGIKQWWLAEQVGVDRKTVIRWLQGQVKFIQQENAIALSKILECELSDLLVKNSADQFATPDDQRTAARLLTSSALLERLGPAGEWDVIESLLKATLVPGLSIGVLTELYNRLTIASWRQSKIDQAELYNRKTLELATGTGDQKMLVAALLNQANILSWKGKTHKSDLAGFSVGFCVASPRAGATASGVRKEFGKSCRRITGSAALSSM